MNYLVRILLILGLSISGFFVCASFADAYSPDNETAFTIMWVSYLLIIITVCFNINL